MKCPHCQNNIHTDFAKTKLVTHKSFPFMTVEDYEQGRSAHSWETDQMVCPSCGKAIIFISKKFLDNELQQIYGNKAAVMIYPAHNVRIPPSAGVPPHLRADYNEAAAVLDLSPKASAALSRRCLQELLKLQGFAMHDLSKAIGAAKPKLPSHLSEALESVREVGNFAAHTQKDSNTGAVIDVEPGEAECNLDVLDGLFDFYYDAPAKAAARMAALNQKLAAAGRKPV